MDSITFERGKTYSFTYTNHEGKTAKRRVTFSDLQHGQFPFHDHRCWVLTGYCLDRKARRTFELGRIADDIALVV